ncbi:MAG: transporter substrate-binding domain-containing protein [Alphaproteobacteria bacterium]|nr:transporter substrate-binding domain-containing protein [Rhodospirillales bacterium]MCW9044986.1 transporter substrate-binding domain-containing protein [Alphaproteobacteria bacterium]
MLLGRLISFIAIFSFYLVAPSFGEDGRVTLIFPEDGYAPYLLPKSHGHKGIMVETLSSALSSQGYTVEINHMPEFRGHMMLEKGKGHFFPTAREWTKTPDKYLWTEPVLSVADNIITRSDSKRSISSIDDLKGLSLGTLYQFTYPSFEPYFITGQINRIDGRNVAQLIKMLLRGRIDAIILDKNILAWEIRNNPNYVLTAFQISKQTYDPVQYRFMVAKQGKLKPVVQAFNKALSGMLQSGKLKKIIESYR